MTTVHVFDPAMCCSTGICGPAVDPQLVRFAADLDWLKSQGTSVTRYNLAQEPAAFASDAAVRAALEQLGDQALPVISIDGAVRSTGRYPLRDELASLAGVQYTAPKRAPLAAMVAADSTDACCTPSPAGDSKESCC